MRKQLTEEARKIAAANNLGVMNPAPGIYLIIEQDSLGTNAREEFKTLAEVEHYLKRIG